MKSAKHKRYTIDNNVNATHNVLCAIVESGQDIHLVHLGTMGVYGYGTAGSGHPRGLPQHPGPERGRRHRDRDLVPHGRTPGRSIT